MSALGQKRTMACGRQVQQSGCHTSPLLSELLVPLVGTHRLFRNAVHGVDFDLVVEHAEVAPVWRTSFEIPDHRYRGLLRARRERPRRRAAEQRDEIAPPHSITSSARAMNVGGTSRRSVRAVLRLIASTNLVACITGRSAGCAPLRMRGIEPDLAKGIGEVGAVAHQPGGFDKNAL